MLSFFDKSQKSFQTSLAPKLASSQRISRKRVVLKKENCDLQLKYKHDATLWQWSAGYEFGLCYPWRRTERPFTHIKSSKKIQELNIRHSDCWGTPDIHLNFLSQSYQTFSSLKTLDIRFSQCRETSPKGLDYLSTGLNRLRLLQNLAIVFSDASLPFTDKGVYSLSKSIKKFQDLRSFELEFDDCVAISNETLKILGNSLKNLRKLEKLSLGFSDCKKITDTGIWHLSEKLKQFKGCLKILGLNFSETEVSDVGLSSIKEVLKRLVSLQSVDLNFHFCSKITNIGLGHLIKGIETLTLKSIVLDLNFCLGISDSNLRDLSKVCKALKELEVFRVDFSGSNVTDTGFCFLREVGNKLKIFEARFCYCFPTTDAALQNLTLRKFASLKTLMISFSNCYHITDVGLETFSEDLSRLVLLENLKICFDVCQKITDKGFFSLCEALKKLVLLENLQLEFSSCSGITRSGGGRLCQIMGVFGSSLKTLQLNFNKIDIIGITQFRMLAENLKNNVKSLERFALKYSDFREIFINEEREIGKRLWHYIEMSQGGTGKSEDVEQSLESGDPQSDLKEEEEVKRRDEQKEEKNRRRFGGFKRLFGCFMKKQSRK